MNIFNIFKRRPSQAKFISAYIHFGPGTVMRVNAKIVSLRLTLGISFFLVLLSSHGQGNGCTTQFFMKKYGKGKYWTHVRMAYAVSAFTTNLAPKLSRVLRGCSWIQPCVDSRSWDLCEQSCCSWSLPCFQGFSPGSPVFFPL